MSMMAHTLPHESDQGQAKPTHPSGRPWVLDDFMEDIPLDPALAWNDSGVLVVENLVPDELIDAYKAEYEQVNAPLTFHDDGTVSGPKIGGYRETAYMYFEQVMRLFTYKPIHDLVESLIGEPPVVHLGLTGYVSTQRQLHRDEYLNPPCVLDRYAAVWVALDDISSDSGPFVYYPGSHLWPGSMTKAAAGKAVDLGDPRWPAHTESVISPLLAAEAERRGVELVRHLPKRGTVLAWNGRTVHAGSIATKQNAYRGAAIFHMSGSLHRPDFPYAPRRWKDQGLYMPYPEAVSPLESM